ncbi:MAG: sulfate ABC transporter substrate-binding protein [Planctomycetota bacterium]|nr:sulfate ABC transporter substrate-binding protein [Planctomycetota bacterium]
MKLCPDHPCVAASSLAKIAISLLGITLAGCDSSSNKTLLNVSYDPTRELWQDLNREFTNTHGEANKTESGEPEVVTVETTHGGSASQARSVIEGLPADVVTLAIEPDTEAIRKKGLIDAGWKERLPNHSLPYVSTIVFVVRKGNPKQIKDWDDLIQGDVQIITPNPTTSGNGKLSFLAAWGYIIKKGGSEEDAKQFVSKLYNSKPTPILDTGARASTTTFAQKKIGDVHLTWENEAFLEVADSKGELEIVYPSNSILAEPYVAVVDANAKKRGTEKLAEEYLTFLYTDNAQRIIGKHHYRPTNPEIAEEFANTFTPIQLYPITDIVKDWDEANTKFFADGGIFTQIYENK